MQSKYSEKTVLAVCGAVGVVTLAVIAAMAHCVVNVVKAITQ